MLPEIAQRTSSSDGEGFSASSAEPVSIMPGVQNPHCSPCSSLKAAWIAWSCPSWNSPSTVVTSRPSACTPNIVQDLIGRPSSSTVQAPQLVVSQPTCVPGEPELLPDQVREEHPRLDVGTAVGAVDLDRDLHRSPFDA